MWHAFHNHLTKCGLKTASTGCQGLLAFIATGCASCCAVVWDTSEAEALRAVPGVPLAVKNLGMDDRLGHNDSVVQRLPCPTMSRGSGRLWYAHAAREQDFSSLFNAHCQYGQAPF